jgi:hypothetical protein
MNKRYISSILVVALLNLCGCYTYSAMTEEEIVNNHPTKKDDLKLILKDGSEIICEYQNSPNTFFVRVEEPSDLVYGRGSILYKEQSPTILFWGEILRDKIDSTSSGYVNGEVYQHFWLKDGNCVILKEGDYVDITLEDGIGYWVSGIKNNQTFIGKVNFDNVEEIQVEGVNWIVVGPMLALIVGLIGTLVIYLSEIQGVGM